MNRIETKNLLKALAFAADKHRFQKRKDVEGTPYINHPIHVALTLMEVGEESNDDLLIAAILHDTIEDTQTTPGEIENIFGQSVLEIVLEVTDDKSLSKEERKRLQIVQASKKSELARKLKLADKICNVIDILHHPPANWSVDRKLQYLDWAEQVLNGLYGSNEKLEIKLRSLIDEGRRMYNSLLST
jgi:guanosine-3',5'-bis(diphosphate) 3'-pyrophosphohydrolase